MNIAEFRSQHPEYNDMRDMDLARALHAKHYSDMPFGEFSKVFLRDNTQTGLGSDGQNFLAGTGKAFVDTKRGLEQINARIADNPQSYLNPVTATMAIAHRLFGRNREEIQKDIDRSVVEDAPLMKTKAGLGGNITGHVAMTLPFGGAGATLPGATGLSALYSAAQPVESGGSRLKNASLGGIGGSIGWGVSRAVPMAWRALVRPFTNRGSDDLAAQGVRGFVGDKADDVIAALKNAKEIVPGSVPTATQATQNAGIRQLQQAVQPAIPGLADDVALRGMEQNAARLNVLRGLAGSEDDLASALSRRSNLANQLYQRTFNKPVRVNEELKTLMGRPVMQDALDAAKRIAANEGQSLGNLYDKSGKFASTKVLHYVKMGLDDVLNGAPQKGIGGTETRAIAGTKDALLKWMDKASPAYKSARVRFEKMSRPINRMQVGQEILGRSTRSELPDILGNPTIFPDALGRAVKGGGESLVKKATGFERPLDKVFRPEQMQSLRDVVLDLARKSSAEKIGRVPGSPTAEYLAGQNLVRNLLGPLGAPDALLKGSAMQQLAKGANVLMGVPNKRAQEKIAKALLDPKYMAKLLEESTKAGEKNLIQEMLGIVPVSAGMRTAPGLLGY